MFTVSIIIPVYTGANYLGRLVDRIDQVKQAWGNKYEGLEIIEAIFVVDDAKDTSLSVLRNLSESNSWLKYIELSKNFGQHPATIAGILHSSGDWVVTLDEDLQHDPLVIDKLLLNTVTNNQDICYARPNSNVHNSFIKDNLAKMFKKLVSYLSGDKNIVKFNSFRLIRGNVARGAAAITEHDSYFDIVLSWFSQRSMVLDVPMTDIRNTNKNDKSGYTFMGLIKHGKRMIMTSKIKFLRIGILIGLLALLSSVLLVFYVLYIRYIDSSEIKIQGWASQALITVFFGGLITLLVSFLLESLSDVLLSINGKPTFFIVNRDRDGELKRILENK